MKSIKETLTELAYAGAVPKIEIVYADAVPKIEIDPEIKIGVEEVYMKDPHYKQFVHSVTMHLRKYMVDFNLKDDEMLEIFARNLIDTMWG